MWNVEFKSYEDSTMYPPINENNFTLTLALGYFFIPTTPLQQFPRDPESKQCKVAMILELLVKANIFIEIH